MRPRRHSLAVFSIIFSVFILTQVLSSGPALPPTVAAPSYAGAPHNYHGHVPRFSSTDSIGFGVYVSGVDINTDIVDGTTYHELAIKGAFPYTRDGAPAVPVIRKLVAIPDCDQISIEVRVTSSTIKQDINVRPADRIVPSQTDVGQFDREFTKDDNVYSTDANFPGEYARIEEIGYLRGQRLAWVHIYPVQFNPARQEITVATDLDIVVRPSNARGEINQGVGPMTDILRRLAINYDLWVGPNAASGLGGGLRASSGNGTVYLCGTAANDWRLAADSVNTLGQPDYLIIMADELSDSLVMVLANHRATYNGFNVSIVKMSQIDSSPGISDTPDTIRAFVKDVYAAKSAAHMADSTLAYVLLMGDAYNPNFDVLLPSSYIFSGGDLLHQYAASDAYYSFLTTDLALNDPYPDLFIGRIPADGDSVFWELSNIVSKTIDYEPLPVATWVDSILLVSGRDDKGFSFHDQGAPGFDNFFNEIIQQQIPGTQAVLKRHRIGNGPDDDFGQALTELVDSVGFRIIGLFDHGFTTGLAGAWFPLHYDAIQNDRANPVVFSIASYSSSFDFEDSLRYLLRDLETGALPCVFDQSHTGLPCKPGSAYLDAYDVFAERILLQPNGAIGVIGYSRTTNTRSAEQNLHDLFHVLFHENAATLGELVFGARIIGPDLVSLRNLQLLGDPAVNILWQDVAWDSIDVAIGSSDIRVANGVKSYAPASNLSISVTVSNLTDTPANSVKVEVLDNHPDSSSVSVLDTGTIGSIPAFGSASIVLDTGSWNPGTVELWVHVDPDSEFNEPTTANNVAHRAFSVLPYLTGFPKLQVQFGQGVILAADVSDSHNGKEIIVSGRCYSATGDSIWAATANTSHRPLLGYPYKDGMLYTLAVRSVAPLFHDIQLLDASNGSIEASFDFDAPNAGPLSSIGNLTQDVLLMDAHASDSLEVLLVARNSADDYDLRLLTIDGTALWTTPIGGTNYMVVSALGMGDINVDGTIEVVCGFGMVGKPDSVMVVDAGSRLWTVAVGDAPSEMQISLADLNGDGDLEILANGGFTTPDSSRLYRLDAATGAEDNSAGFPGAPLRYAVGDIESDDDFDIVVAAGDSLAVLDGTLQLQSGRSLGDVIGPISPPLLVDIVGSDDLEIIVLAEAIDTLTGLYFLELQTYSASLDSVGPWYRFHHYKNARIAHPTIADINVDGVYDLMLVTADSVLHAVEIGTDAGQREWGQPFQNNMQTGLIEQPVRGVYSEPASLFNRVRVTGDATFDSTLYIDATADIAVVATDTLIEFNANGHFTLAGSPTSVVRIYSDPASSDSAAWAGIRFENGSGAGVDSMMHFVVSDAATGIEIHSLLLIRDGHVKDTYSTGVSAADSLTMYRVDISGVEACSTAVKSSGGLVVQESSLRASQYAVHATGGTVTLVADTLLGAKSPYGITGVRLDSVVSQATVEDCHIANFGNGIDADTDVEVIDSSILYGLTGVSTTDSLTIEGSTITYSGSGPAGLAISGTRGSIKGSTISALVTAVDLGSGTLLADTLTAGATGLRIGGSVTCRSSKITGTSGAFTGIDVSSSTDSLTLRQTTVTGFDTGVYVASGARADIDSCTISNNDIGVEVYGSTVSGIRHSTLNANTTDGIYCHYSSYITVEGNTITNSSVGIYFLDTCDGDVQNENVIQNHVVGIKCDDDSDPVIRGNKISGNTFGVYALNNAYPSLGQGCSVDSCNVTGCSTEGGNKITNNSSHHVVNLSGSPAVMAECNYWGSRGPLPGKFSGVDYSPHMTSDPLPNLVTGEDSADDEDEEQEESLPTAYHMAQNAPNPFNPTTVIRYQVPPPGGRVGIVVYNVLGQRVRTLVSEPKPAGFYGVSWDGRNERGQSVASGIYFVRMTADRFVQTRKLVLIK